MKFLTASTLLFLSLSAGWAAAQDAQKLYRWVDGEGVVHYGDSIPAEFSEVERQIVNEHGITVDVLHAKKTEEEILEEQRLEKLARDRELQRRADQALLATYLSVDEILMHRDRRVELFQAQSRVTELFLTNLASRLSKLEREASRYLPYSTDPDAPQISPDLVDEMSYTRDTIERHESNLQQFQTDEATIIARFEGDINRFKDLKGIE